MRLMNTLENGFTSLCSLCLYVDDYITGTETKENASELRTQAREIMASAGMDLCKWRTNNKALQAEWSKEDTEEIKTSSLLKVLGLVWRPETDYFIFDMTDLLEHVKDKRPTKRSVLQTTSRIFDPIGFLSPFIIRVKILFQEMWERGLEWDEDLPKDLATRWSQKTSLCGMSYYQLQ